MPLLSAIAVAWPPRRIGRARAWLESRVHAEEVLVVGATLDAANELARRVAKEKGAAFGWHRLTLPQLAVRPCSARASDAWAGSPQPTWDRGSRSPG